MLAVHLDIFARRVMGVDASRSAIAAKTKGTEHLEGRGGFVRSRRSLRDCGRGVRKAPDCRYAKKVNLSVGHYECSFDHSRIEVSDGFLVDDKCITKWYRGQMLSHQACSAE